MSREQRIRELDLNSPCIIKNCQIDKSAKLSGTTFVTILIHLRLSVI